MQAPVGFNRQLFITKLFQHLNKFNGHKALYNLQVLTKVNHAIVIFNKVIMLQSFGNGLHY